MKKLPLYPEVPAPLRGPVRELSPGCTVCELHKEARSVCMNPEGDPGGLLVIGEWPSKVDDQVGRPVSSVSGKQLREIVKRWWSKPVAYDNVHPPRS